MEKQYDRDLRGSAGAVQLEVNALGRVIRELDRQEGVAGEEIGLTIDVALQRTVLGSLAMSSASCVVLDCRNGEVLAMGHQSVVRSGAVQCRRDAGAVDGVGAGQANTAAQSRRSRRVRAWLDIQDGGGDGRPGGGDRSPGDTVHCPGYLDLGNARFHCWRQGGHGTLDLRGGLKNSCDVYFYETARRVGIDRIAAMAHRFGLGTELAIDLPGARSGFIPTREWRMSQGHPWNAGDTVVSGIGQGYIQVTPLELATYAARVATGREVQPHLTRKLGGVLQSGSQAADWPSLNLSGPLAARRARRDVGGGE